MSSQIDIRLKAIDEASKTIAEASSRIKSELKNVEAAGSRVKRGQEEVSKSSRQLVTGFSGLATGAFALYNAVDRVQDMQVSIDRANLQVKSSLNSVEAAQRRYNKALEEGDPEKVKIALDDLNLAQERYQVACDRAEMIQGNLNETIMSSALSVIPTAITMVDSFAKVWKNIPDVSGVLKSITGAMGGLTAQTDLAAASVAGVTSKLGILKAIGAVAIPIVITIAAAWLHREAAKAVEEETKRTGLTPEMVPPGTVREVMFPQTYWKGRWSKTMDTFEGVTKWLEDTLAGIKAALGMAEGGIVRKPTLALIGEREPEIVLPLSKFSKVIEKTREVAESSNLVSTSLVEKISAVSETSKVISSSIIEKIPRFAWGGIVLSPMLGLLGEAGPEVVVPLGRAGAVGEAAQYITVNPTINIGNISTELDLPRVIGAVSTGIAEALRRRL